MSCPSLLYFCLEQMSQQNLDAVHGVAWSRSCAAHPLAPPPECLGPMSVLPTPVSLQLVPTYSSQGQCIPDLDSCVRSRGSWLQRRLTGRAPGLCSRELGSSSPLALGRAPCPPASCSSTHVQGFFLRLEPMATTFTSPVPWLVVGDASFQCLAWLNHVCWET